MIDDWNAGAGYIKGRKSCEEEEISFLRAQLAKAIEALRPYVEWESAVDNDERQRAAKVFEELTDKN